MTTTTVSFDHLLPEGFALKDFQTVGVAYASATRRVLIADEMGLGKTIQALVTLEANDAFPAVVVCPASLRGNWVNEVRRFLPHRSVTAVYGTRPYEVDTDIVVIGQDVLKHWVDAVAQPNALVLDESHYFKTPKAQRTQAARRLADSVPAEGVVICLTGTPVQNRPVELVSQLQILNVLDKVAPKPHRPSGPNGTYTERDWEYAFKFRFCGPEHNGHGYTFTGASNLDQLNEALRGSCYVRRERAEVVGLNDTRRVVLPLSLNGALKEYRAAEASILDFVRREAALKAEAEALENGDDPEAAAQIAANKAKQAVLRAEILVTLTTLRRLAGEAKVEAAAEWVENFLDSNPTKSLVIFAWHKDVQKALVEALAAHNPAQILAGQADVEAQKARFQNGETKVIVCSIKAAAEGHTLTAASDVLFVEQPWHPGAEQQCEDRCNRIGQEAEQVFAWKLLAADTIDEQVHALIEEKRSVYRAAVIGGDIDGVASSVEEDLLARLREVAG